MEAQEERVSRARALLLEAERLEHEGESMQAAKRYQAAYKLDPNLEDEQYSAYDDDAEGAAQVEVRTGAVPHFSVGDPGWMQHLETEGYAVITGCCTPDEITGAIDSLWSFMEGLEGAEIKRADPDTWGRDSWPADPKTGICTRHSFQHSDFCWRARLNPKVQRAFASVWGVAPSDLITSFDAGNFFRPWWQAGRPEWKTEGGWFHVDQNAAEPICHTGKMCVQGVLTYTDASAATGGLTVLPRSHAEHGAMCERHPPVYGDYFPLKKNDPLLSRPAQLVTAPAGSLLLWDSRKMTQQRPSGLHSSPKSQRCLCGQAPFTATRRHKSHQMPPPRQRRSLSCYGRSRTCAWYREPSPTRRRCTTACKHGRREQGAATGRSFWLRRRTRRHARSRTRRQKCSGWWARSRSRSRSRSNDESTQGCPGGDGAGVRSGAAGETERPERGTIQWRLRTVKLILHYCAQVKSLDPLG